MSQKYKFYGVAGLNGYGVFDDYEKVLKERGKLIEVNTCGFYTFTDAYDWAAQRFTMLQQKYGNRYYKISMIKKTNRLYYRKCYYS